MKRIVFDGGCIGPWVREKAGGVYTPGDPGIAIERDGELVVGVTYDSHTGSSICIHSRCDDRRAPSRRFYWMIFEYPFNQLRVTCVRGLVCIANAEAIRVNEKLGFKREAVLADYFPEGDGIVFVMRKKDCRWLSLGSRYQPLRRAA